MLLPGLLEGGFLCFGAGRAPRGLRLDVVRIDDCGDEAGENLARPRICAFLTATASAGGANSRLHGYNTKMQLNQAAQPAQPLPVIQKSTGESGAA